MNLSKEIVNSLFYVLNNDPSENVRLAAIEQLTKLATNKDIKLELVRSLGNQDSPIVQLELLESLMLHLTNEDINEIKKKLNVNGESFLSEVKKLIRAI